MTRKKPRFASNGPIHRSEFLDNVPDLFYSGENSYQQQGAKEKSVIEVNFHLGENPVRVDNPLTLDPNIVRMVKALARRAARQDFEAISEK